MIFVTFVSLVECQCFHNGSAYTNNSRQQSYTNRYLELRFAQIVDPFSPPEPRHHTNILLVFIIEYLLTIQLKENNFSVSMNTIHHT